MRHPQIVVLETDGALAGLLGPLAEQRRWLLRESRQAPACLSLLKAGGPTVLVMKLGRHLVREMTFLDEVHATLPDLPIVVASDAEDPTLMSLAMELGARCVLQLKPDIAEIVGSLLDARIPPTTLPQSKTLPIEAIADEPES